MLPVVRLISVAALVGCAAAPAAATIYVVNPTYAPGINGTYTQISQGTGTYGVELRGGNGTTNGDWEIGVGSRTSVNGFFTQGQFNWGCGANGATGCGTIFDYVLTWKPASTPQSAATLTISLTPQGVTNPPTTTVATPIGQGYAPLAGNTLRIWAKRDASFTVSEVDGQAFSISRTGDA